MKKFALLILLSTIFFITSCSEKKTIEPKYQNLTLTAPNGQQIAESFESLNEEIKDMVGTVVKRIKLYNKLIANVI